MGEARNKPTKCIAPYGLGLMIIIGVAARCSAIECSAVKARKHFGTQSTLRHRCSAIECSAVQCSCALMPYTVAFCSLSGFCSPRVEMHLHI
jgi:hypothetical protein